jgi:hypothetical protein
MSSADQPLNSLGRFRKQAGRLVLEQHDHCEVPAGCGGVVLRWRNPHAARPLIVYLFPLARATLFLDGTVPPTARVDLAPGRHVAALVLENADLSAGLLLFAATSPGPPGGRARPPRSDVVEPPVKVVTAPDGTWKFTLDELPGDDWKALAFDAAGWSALVGAATPRLGQGDPGAYALRRCTEQGAACLKLPPAAGLPAAATVRVRKVFEVAGPEGGSPP